MHDNGVAFDARSVVAQPIREDQEYGGVRAVFGASIAGAKVRLQVDVGFGDVVTPEPTIVEVPALLDFPPPRLRGYPRETVVAEKLNAIVDLGLANSRMKDFFDLYVLATTFAFDGGPLARAVRATFDRRATTIPEDLPIALTSAFRDSEAKQQQWLAFGRKATILEVPTLADTLAIVAELAVPLLAAARRDEAWRARWPAGGPWLLTSGASG